MQMGLFSVLVRKTGMEKDVAILISAFRLRALIVEYAIMTTEVVTFRANVRTAGSVKSVKIKISVFQFHA